MTGHRQALAPTPASSPVSHPHDPAEREAHHAAERATGVSTPAAWTSGGETTSAVDTGYIDGVVRSTGRPLDAAVRGQMESRFGYDFGAVRIHDDPTAREAAHAAQAHAFTVGDNVGFAADQYAPHTSSGRHLLAHELAHVVQNRGRQGGNRIMLQKAPAPASFLDELPESERKRIIVRGERYYKSPDLQSLFKAGTTMDKKLPKTTSLELRSVPAAMETGLGNIATDLVNIGNLPTNSTIVLKISVTEGSGTFRFTHSKQLKAKTAQVVVEDETPKPPAAPAKVAGKKDTAKKADKKTADAKPAPDPYEEKVKKASLTVDGFFGSELATLKSALAKIPESQLSLVSGLTIRKQTDQASDPQKAKDESANKNLTGMYRFKHHSVTIYDKAFADTSSTFADKGKGEGISAAARWMIHEIGHAIDFSNKRVAQLELEKKTAAAKKEKAEYDTATEKVKGAGKPSTKAKPNEKYDEAKKAQATARDELTKAQATQKTAAAVAKGTKTLSGMAKDYQAAAGKDGVGFKGSAISKYGATDWGEHFAEAYSYYLASPELMKKLRPNTFDYFAKNLPK